MFTVHVWGGGGANQLVTLGRGGGDWVAHHVCMNRVILIMTHIRHYVAFGIMSHSALCRFRGYVVWHYVAFGLMSFGIMLFGIMLHSALCCIRPYVLRHSVAFGIMSH